MRARVSADDVPAANDQQPEDSWDRVIRPRRHLLDINLWELWDYRDLLYMFVKRDIITVYKQTVLGPIWFFVQPVMTMVVYVVVFGNIAKIDTDGIPKPLFYLAGIIIWNYFAESFTKTSSTFTSNANLFGKVYFPRLVVPLSQVLSGLIKFVIQFSLFLVVYLYHYFQGDVQPNTWIVSSPLLLLLMALLGLGVGIIFSSLTTKYRDLTFLMQFGVQLAMYATPIIYPSSLLSGTMKSVMWCNPLAHVVETFKCGFLGVGEASIGGLAYAIVFAIVLLATGVAVFSHTEKTFIDTV